MSTMTVSTSSASCSHSFDAGRQGTKDQIKIGGPRAQLIYLDQISVAERVYKLSGLVGLSLRQDDGLWVADNEYLNLHAYGESFAEVVEMLGDRFDHLYRRVAQSPDNQLTREAVELKAKLLELVESIE